MFLLLIIFDNTNYYEFKKMRKISYDNKNIKTSTSFNCIDVLLFVENFINPFKKKTKKKK